jgi:hypothetical protein
MSYFANVTTLADAKERYRTLAKQHHPDAGGNTAVMQEINAEWETIAQLLAAQALAPALRGPPHHSTALVLEQHRRMWAAMLDSARRLCPGVHVYHRGNSYYHHVCIAIPANHPARETLRAAGYTRHSAWKCWRKERTQFAEYDALVAWLRGDRHDPPFADVVELEAQR